MVRVRGHLLYKISRGKHSHQSSKYVATYPFGEAGLAGEASVLTVFLMYRGPSRLAEASNVSMSRVCTISCGIGNWRLILMGKLLRTIPLVVCMCMRVCVYGRGGGSHWDLQ